MIKWIDVLGFVVMNLDIKYYLIMDKICDKIKYLISEKIGITDSINHNFGKKS